MRAGGEGTWHMKAGMMQAETVNKRMGIGRADGAQTDGVPGRTHSGDGGLYAVGTYGHRRFCILRRKYCVPAASGGYSSVKFLPVEYVSRFM